MLFPSASSSLLARIHRVGSLGQLLTLAAKDAHYEIGGSNLGAWRWRSRAEEELEEGRRASQTVTGYTG